MFGKSLNLVLLGCALALANPIQRNEELVQQTEYDVDISLWLQDAHEGIKQAFKETVQPFKNTYNSLVKAGKNDQEYNKDKIEQLQSIFHDITDESREQLSDIEVVVLTKTIGNLQSVVESLNMIPFGSGTEQGINKNIQAGQQALNKGDQNGQIENVKPNDGDFTEGPGPYSIFRNGVENTAGDSVNRANNLQNQFNQFVQSGVTISDKLGGGAHSILNEGVDNVKGLFVQPGVTITDKLGGGAHSIFNEGVDNVKGLFVQPGVMITDKLGGEAHSILNEGVDNVKGLFVQPGVTITDKLGGGVHSTLNNVVDNVKGNAYQVQDTVNGFFNTDNAAGYLNHLGNTVQGTIGSGVENVKGNLNHWGSEGLNLGEGLFNQFGDDAQKAFNTGKNAIDKGVENVQGNLNQWGNELVEGANKFGNQAQDSLNNGIHNAAGYLNHLGNTVQGTIGSGVENVKGNVNHWVSEGLNLGGGLFNQFGDVAQKAFNTGKNAINKGVKNVQGNLNQWGNELIEGANKFGNQAQDSLNNGIHNAAGYLNHLGNTVQGTIGNGVENVKGNLNHWGSEGLNLGEGFFNQFGNVVQKAFNTGKNTIDKGMENTQGHLNHWGNELVEGAKKFGNQAQDSLNNGIHEVQNQVNQYVPSTNNLYKGNVYNNRLVLDNTATQLAGAVAVQMSNMRQSLLQWKNVVDNFLANGKNIVGHQAQAVNEGVGHIKEKIEKPAKGDGRFSMIGQKVGANIGGEVDKFTSAFGGMWQNAANIFGK